MMEFDPKTAYAPSLPSMIKKQMCPKIVLKGWWWKKYFPHYRNLSKTMNAIMLKDWMDGGAEKFLDESQHKMILQFLKNGTEVNYTKNI